MAKIFQVTVDLDGPIWDGRAEHGMHVIVDRALKECADDGEDQVRGRFHEVFKNPTGFYESHLRTHRMAPNEWAVDDGYPDAPHTVYGPWLEGVGSRNYPVTRFKGYFTFRIITEKMSRRVGTIASRVFRENKWRVE